MHFDNKRTFCHLFTVDSGVGIIYNNITGNFLWYDPYEFFVVVICTEFHDIANYVVYYDLKINQINNVNTNIIVMCLNCSCCKLSFETEFSATIRGDSKQFIIGVDYFEKIDLSVKLSFENSVKILNLSQ